MLTSKSHAYLVCAKALIKALENNARIRLELGRKQDRTPVCPYCEEGEGKCECDDE